MRFYNRIWKFKKTWFWGQNLKSSWSFKKNSLGAPSFRNYIWFFRVMLAKFRVIRCDRPFSGQTNSFPAVLILQMLSSSMNSIFFGKNFGARRARAKLWALEKRASFSSVAKSGRNKQNFCRNVRNGKKKIFGLTEIFVNTSSDQNLILCKKKRVHVDVNIQEYCNISLLCCCTYINHFLRYEDD